MSSEYFYFFILNVAAEGLALLLCIREIAGSSLDLEAG
jgi:hypothetical protein